MSKGQMGCRRGLKGQSVQGSKGECKFNGGESLSFKRCKVRVRYHWSERRAFVLGEVELSESVLFDIVEDVLPWPRTRRL